MAEKKFEKAEDKARAEKQDTGLPALENRVAALERVVLGGAPPEGIAGVRAPSAEKTEEQQAAFEKEEKAAKK
jgi:hypothetical protein